MNLNRILRHFRNSWRTLAGCAVAGLLLGGLATLIQSPSYEAKATVLVSPNGPLGSVGSAPGSDAYFIQQRAQAYAEFATSPKVLTPAADQAGLDELDDVSVQVQWLATSPASVHITVTQPSARAAADAANAIAEELRSAVATLERPEDGGRAIVKLAVSRAADLPLSPVSPDPVVYLLLGLVAGLAVGFPLVLAKLLLGRDVSDSTAVVEATGEPPLGVIDAADTDVSLILRDAPQSVPAEAFRKLRTSVQFAKPDAGVGSIVVCAPQLGAGGTTVAVNLAWATAEAGRRVVLVDGNLRDRAASRLLGFDDGPGLAEVLSGEVELEAALRSGGAPDLLVLAAGQGAGQAGGVLAGARMVTLLERLETQADLVIIDSPPVLPYAEAAELAAIADAALLVARFGQTSLDDLQQARSTLAQVGTTVLGVVLNGGGARGRAAGVAAVTSPPRPTTGRATSEPAEPELVEHPSR